MNCSSDNVFLVWCWSTRSELKGMTHISCLLIKGRVHFSSVQSQRHSNDWECIIMEFLISEFETLMVWVAVLEYVVNPIQFCAWECCQRIVRRILLSIFHHRGLLSWMKCSHNTIWTICFPFWQTQELTPSNVCDPFETSVTPDGVSSLSHFLHRHLKGIFHRRVK